MGTFLLLLILFGLGLLLLCWLQIWEQEQQRPLDVPQGSTLPVAAQSGKAAASAEESQAAVTAAAVEAPQAHPEPEADTAAAAPQPEAAPVAEASQASEAPASETGDDSQARQDVLERVRQRPGMRQPQLYRALKGYNRQYLRGLLLEMARAGDITREKEQNTYRLFPVETDSHQ